MAPQVRSDTRNLLISVKTFYCFFAQSKAQPVPSELLPCRKNHETETKGN